MVNIIEVYFKDIFISSQPANGGFRPFVNSLVGRISFDKMSIFTALHISMVNLKCGVQWEVGDKCLFIGPKRSNFDPPPQPPESGPNTKGI